MKLMNFQENVNMTPIQLANKINELNEEMQNKDMQDDDLVNLIEQLIYGVQPEQELQLEIETYEYLPCSLKVFNINGIRGNINDFGETTSDGSALRGNCHNEFIPHKKADRAVLRKYGITFAQFQEIGERLEEELYIGGCGYCS